MDTEQHPEEHPEQHPVLERLEDTDLTVSELANDVRGRTVVDRNGDEVGTVESLFVDRDERQVRFLEVSSGGFLGIGASRQLVPVEAVTTVDAETVHIDKDREHVARGPGYDPELARREPAYFGDVYGYYGTVPFWAPGYVPPGRPFR